MKLPLLTFALLTFHFSAFPQDSIAVKDMFKSKSHWGFGISQGFTLPSILPVYGQVQAYKVTGKVFAGGFTYSNNLSTRFGLFVAGKLGGYPMQLGIPETKLSLGTDESYFRETEYQGYTEVGSGISVNQFINRKYVMRNVAGGGFKFTGSSVLGSGTGTSTTRTSRSWFDLESTAEVKPFILLGTGLSVKLKNQDLLGFTISYYHSLKDIFTGSYYIADNSPLYSYGDLRYKGHELSLGLNYTFSGYEKKLKHDAAVKKGITTKKEIRGQLKKEYYQDRLGKSSSIRGYTGPFIGRSTAPNSDEPITGYNSLEGGGGMDFMREFNPRLFWEAGWNFKDCWVGYGISYNGTRSLGGDNFQAFQLSGGSGYILRNKYLVPQLYISAGAAIAYNGFGVKKGDRGGGTQSYGNFRTGKFLDVTSSGYIHHTVYPLVYLGIRKDIQLRQRVFLSLAVRSHQGLFKIYTNQIAYTTTETGSTEYNASAFTRGSYTLFSLGLKVDL